MSGRRQPATAQRGHRRRGLHELQPLRPVRCGYCGQLTRKVEGVSLLFDQEGELSECVWWCSRECLRAGQEELIAAGVAKVAETAL